LIFTFVIKVKINGSNREMLEAAAEQFGGKSEEDIKEICLVSLGSY
jgi:hypothetical protein